MAKKIILVDNKSSNNDKTEKLNMFNELMKNDKFINDILSTEDGQDLIDKFESYGIDLNQIEFSELCKNLAEKLQLKNDISIEVNSLINPISVDYENNNGNQIIHHFDDTKV